MLAAALSQKSQSGRISGESASRYTAAPMMMEIAAPCRFSAEKYAIASFSAGTPKNDALFAPNGVSSSPGSAPRKGSAAALPSSANAVVPFM